MKTIEPAQTAIEQLSLLRPDQPATFDDLVALNTARECIDKLFRDYIDELSSDPRTAAVWSAVGSAVKMTSKPAPGTRTSYGQHTTDALPNRRIRSFWDTHAKRLTWDFLPFDFVHALYVQWLGATYPMDAPVSRETFPRRLKAVATASGEWNHTRSRPGSLMNAAEPLAERLPGWSHDGTNRAIYGLRRSGI